MNNIMENCIFTNNISKELGLTEHSVNNTLQLLEDGCTIPFISRYRKERTGGLDEVQISAINELYEKLKDISKRKETILKTIIEQGKLTPDAWMRGAVGEAMSVEPILNAVSKAL
jgi:uncharacterized protein